MTKSLQYLAAKHWWVTPLTIFLCWRLFVELVARIVLASPPFSAPLWPAGQLALWARWDSWYYFTIITHGYQMVAGHINNVTFFPLYPLLWRAVEYLTHLPRLMAGVLTANLAAAAGCLALWRWIANEYGESRATYALVALLAFPSSFFLIAAYSDSTLLLCLALSLLAASHKRWGWAALAAACASAARPVGILLWPVLLWRWYANKKERRPRDLVTLLILPSLGLVLFSLYLWRATGDPLGWLHNQAWAFRNFALPTTLLQRYIRNITLYRPYWAQHAVELIVLAFALAVAPAVKRLSKDQVLLFILSLLPPLFSNSLQSLQRFLIVIPGIFIALAGLKQRWFVAYLAISLPLLVFSISQFITWQWAG